MKPGACAKCSNPVAFIGCDCGLAIARMLCQITISAMKSFRSENFITILIWATICVSTLLGQEPLGSVNSNWPTIRGPAWNGQSFETGIAEKWPKEGPPVLWTRELGQGYSSFIAWDNYVATQFQTIGGQYVICLFSDSGRTKWQYRYDWPYDPAGVYPGPRSTPTHDDGFVYFTSPSGLIGCLNAESGSLVWSIQLEKTFSVKVPGFGYSCSPIVEGEKIFLPVGGRDASMVALDKRSGKIIWKAVDSKSIVGTPTLKSSESTASYASAYPISFRGRRCVVGYLQNTIVCHDMFGLFSVVSPPKPSF